MGTPNLFDVAVDLGEMGRRLEQAMDEAGLTVNRLSYATEIDTTLLRKYLKGQTEPGATRLARIAEALGVSVDWLVQNSDVPRPQQTWDGKSERRASSPTSGGAPAGELPVPRKRPGRRRSA